jgi:hypothetical protein
VELSQWLSESEAVEEPPGEDVERLSAQLETTAARLAGACADRAWPAWWSPLVLTKRVLLLHGRCEGAALASLGHRDEADGGWPVLRGRALDLLVAHRIFRGPCGDPAADLLEMLRGAGDAAEAELLGAALDRSRREELVALADAVAAFESCRGRAPRVEVSVGADLAGGAVRLPGRLDVLVGGPGTPWPAVVIEVKSTGSGHTYAHAEELRHYALLCALRHGRPPAGLAIWYPDRTTVPLLVEGAATSAQRRVLDVMEALAEVVEGRTVELRPGGQCRWCAHAPRCPAADMGDPGDDRVDVAGDEELWWPEGAPR